MLVRDMTREMISALLKDASVGRIACARGSQPYVTPFSFAYHKDFIYSFATVGKKVEWMRANPLVCVEIDKIASHQEWQTVVIFGRYQELPRTPDFYEAQIVAHHVLSQTANWWEPGFVRTLRGESERPLETIYFRVSVDEISGHQGVPDCPIVRED